MARAARRPPRWWRWRTSPASAGRPVGHLDARSDGARVLVERGAEVADAAAEDLAGYAGTVTLALAPMRTLASALPAGRPGSTGSRSATLKAVRQAGQFAERGFLRSRCQQRGAVTGEGRDPAPLALGEPPSRRSRSADARKLAAALSRSALARGSPARDDLFGVERFGALEVGFGNAQFSLRLVERGMRFAHRHAVQRGQRLNRHLVAQLCRHRRDTAFDACRHVAPAGRRRGGWWR